MKKLTLLLAALAFATPAFAVPAPKVALRSIADLNVVETISEDSVALKKGEGINVVRYGVQSATTTQK